jgi:hypothetical protein
MKTIIQRIQKLECTSGFGLAGADHPQSIDLQFICPEPKIDPPWSASEADIAAVPRRGDVDPGPSPDVYVFSRETV